MLDDRAYRDAKKKQIDSCPNCARIMNMKDRADNFASTGKKTTMSTSSTVSGMAAPIHLSMRNINAPEIHNNAVYMPRRHHNRQDTHSSRRMNSPVMQQNIRSLEMNGRNSTDGWVRTNLDPAHGDASSGIPPPPPSFATYVPSAVPGANQNILGSPMTRQILGRQKHTRHISMDISNVAYNPRTRKYSADLPAAQTPPTISESAPLNPPLSAPNPTAELPFQPQGQGSHSLRGSVFVNDENYDSATEDEDEDYSDDDESSETPSTIDEIVNENSSKIKAAKYVFLTLKQALVNSMVIIAVGCVGFMLTEEFSNVDSWYFVSMSNNPPFPIQLCPSFSHMIHFNSTDDGASNNCWLR